MDEAAARGVVEGGVGFQAVEQITPHVVRISTPRGSGTGFLVSQGKNTTLCAIATAAHVIDQSHYWEEPIRIDHHSSGKSVLLRHPERVISIATDKDTASILLDRKDLPLPSDPLELIPAGKSLKVGNDIGWLGFPAIASTSLCFFGGRVSAWLEADSAYLVDGVAINGVSGGPAFLLGAGKPVIIGVVSAYMPNRATGETLPGLGVVRDVKQFHELAPSFASIDQAKSEETPVGPVPPGPSPRDARNNDSQGGVLPPNNDLQPTAVGRTARRRG